MKLDIACGRNKQKGFKGVDIFPGPGIDFVWNLEKFPWEPFKDNACEEIYIGNYLEKVEDLPTFMNEVYRICQNGAVVKIFSPYYTSVRAWQDPLNARAISEATFLYFDKEWRIGSKLEHHPMTCHFKTSNILTFINEPWNNKSEEAKQFAQRHYWNVVSDIYAELKTIK